MGHHSRTGKHLCGYIFKNDGPSPSGKATDFDSVTRGFESRRPSQKETTIFDRRLSFLFVLFTFLFSFFSLLTNCRFQRKDKREKRREKVALLRKALNYIIICVIIQREVMVNEQSFAR